MIPSGEGFPADNLVGPAVDDRLEPGLDASGFQSLYKFKCQLTALFQLQA
jgi:hypothetical protein